MTNLTAEHFIDMREAVQRRINELQGTNPGLEARAERDRKVKSLTEALAKVDETAKDLIFEEAKLPFGECLKPVACDHCFWNGQAGDLKQILIGVNRRVLIETCPRCGGHHISIRSTEKK